jgi:UDP-N-acetylmuramoyl-tripeptide--D-alanyl-D-alanine ligase
MGMTQPGQITQLVQIAAPDVALITTIALVAGAENFPTIEDTARAKAEILSHPKTALGIIPLDFPIYDEVMKSHIPCYKMTFSLTDRKANYYLEESKGLFRIYENSEVVTLPAISQPGKHIRQNLLAALAVVRNLGLSWRDIQKALPHLKLPERRFEQIERLGVLFINDSYNASEQSIKAALDILPCPKPGKKRIAIIGEIVGLGRFSEGCHHAVGEASLKCVDRMICLGQGCRPIVDCWQQASRPVAWCESLDEVIKELKLQIEPGDVVLLKGSNKNNLWNVLKAFE